MRQLPLDLKIRPMMGVADFFEAPCNAEAVSLVTKLPKGLYGAIIIGEAGSGKTHLMHLFADTVKSTKNEEVFFCEADGLNLETVRTVLDKTPFAVVENCTSAMNEEALFHLLNSCRDRRGFVLMSARCPWNVALNDLKTRLAALPRAQIGHPDDTAMRLVLLKHFSDRQLRVAPEVIDYILKHTERSFSSAAAVVAAADGLSLSEKREITVPLIKTVLDGLA